MTITSGEGWNIVKGDWVRLRQVIQRLARLVVPKIEDDINTLGGRVDALESSGVEIDFDLPLMEGFTWTVDGGVPKWSAGTIKYGDTTYDISAWSAGDTTSATRAIYWTLTNEGTAKEQTKFYGQNTPTSYASRWFVAFFNGSTIFPALQSSIIHGGLIQAGTITTNHLEALSITGDKISGTTIAASKLIAHTITANEIAAGTITATQIAADTITASQIAASTITTSELNFTPVLSGGSATDVNNNSTQISAGKILISGTTDLADWSHPSDTTAINGGNIYAGSSITLGASGHLKSTGKDSAADTTNGFFLGHDGGSSYDFAVGDGTNSIVWDGSAATLTVTGTINCTDLTNGVIDAGAVTNTVVETVATSTVSGTSVSTLEEVDDTFIVTSSIVETLVPL